MLSILITHYNRIDSLELCINSIKSLDLKIDHEIVISDDFSSKDVIAKLKTLSINKLLLSEKNTGLANNINRGLVACKGDFILYVQEDFIAKESLGNVIKEAISFIEDNKVEMVRFTANYHFSKLIPLSANFSKIPNFSFENFNLNTYRYSDHPFVVKKSFYDKYGFYMEDTTGYYGEAEYAIRMLNNSVKIGISNVYHFYHNRESISVLHTLKQKKFNLKKKFPKGIQKFVRSLRQYYEWLIYSNETRGLKTYKNGRYIKKN